MEEKQGYIVEITPEGEFHYLQLLEYLYKYHSEESADRKSNEVLDMAMSLDKEPRRGRKEDKLDILGKDHRFLLYYYTSRKSIKIIYFVEETNKTVYITDFFPTEMNDKKIRRRNV
ncbi:MAG: hypothetical protein JXQ96_17395 [Cyclobacteriaceae bacterium]